MTKLNTDDPVALRKQLLQMRLELNRQKIRHEALVLIEPVQKARNIKNQLTQGTQPLLLVAGATLAGFFITRKSSTTSNLLSFVRIAASLMPLLIKATQGNDRNDDTEQDNPAA